MDKMCLDDMRCMFEYRAVAGGALSVDSIGNLGNVYVIITQSNFTRNSAEGSLSGSDFTTLGGLGGALRIFAAVLWLDGTQFTQNLAGTVGGAIFFNQLCALVSRCSLRLVCAELTTHRTAELSSRHAMMIFGMYVDVCLSSCYMPHAVSAAQLHVDSCFVNCKHGLGTASSDLTCYCCGLLPPCSHLVDCKHQLTCTDAAVYRLRWCTTLHSISLTWEATSRIRLAPCLWFRRRNLRPT